LRDVLRVAILADARSIASVRGEPSGILRWMRVTAGWRNDSVKPRAPSKSNGLNISS
jgi:hypothetical protein